MELLQIIERYQPVKMSIIAEQSDLTITQVQKAVAKLVKEKKVKAMPNLQNLKTPYYEIAEPEES